MKFRIREVSFIEGNMTRENDLLSDKLSTSIPSMINGRSKVDASR